MDMGQDGQAEAAGGWAEDGWDENPNNGGAGAGAGANQDVLLAAALHAHDQGDNAAMAALAEASIRALGGSPAVRTLVYFVF